MNRAAFCALCAAGLLLSLPGCRFGSVASSGEQQPDERPAELGLELGELQQLRGQLERELALLGTLEPGPAVAGQRQRLRSALSLLDKLERIHEGRGSADDREAAAARAYAAYVRTSAGGIPLDFSTGEQLGEAVTGGVGAPDLRLASSLHDRGDLEGALAEGLAVLDSLQEAGLDSLSLRFLLGTWALELGDGISAEEQFEAIVGAEGGEALLVERARQGQSAARSLLMGPDAAALADVRELYELGRYGEADELVATLLLDGEDPEVLRHAEALQEQLREEAAELAEARLARVDALLSGPGPYDAIGPLLDEVAALPAGTWDPQEERRLRAWHRGLTQESGREEAEADRRQLEQTLAAARALVASEDYRAALEEFRRLDGTPLQVTARLEASQAADVLVKQERERAGRLFVAARKLGAVDSKIAALLEVREILGGLLEDFPESSYADRVTANLEAVEAELRSAGWEG